MTHIANAALDRCWQQLRPRIEAHLQAAAQAGKALPELALSVEQLDESIGVAVARFTDGVIFAERFSLRDACVEHLQAAHPDIELTPEIAAAIGELRASDNIADVRVVAANVHRAFVLVTPRPPTDDDDAAAWSLPREPFLMLIDPAERRDRVMQ